MTAFLVSLGTAAVLTGVLVPVLRRLGLQDVPNARSSHTAATPRGGGIGLLAAVVVAVAVVGGQALEQGRVVLLAALAMALIGLVDDARSIRSSIRLVLQATVAVGASLALAAGTEGGTALTAPVLAAVAVATVGTVAYVNAFNFMDGVNGISALNAVVCGGWFVWVGVQADVRTLAILGAAVAGAALGFLPWNASSRVFLGDVGSYGIGALIAVGVAFGWAAGVPLSLLLAPTLVYLADTGWVLVKKVRDRRPLAQAHRDHVYQRLVALGWPHLASAAWTAALAALVCVTAAVLHEHAPAVAVAVAAGVMLLHLSAPRLVERLPTSRTVAP